MTGGAIVHGDPRFSARDDAFAGCARLCRRRLRRDRRAPSGYEVRSYVGGAPSPRACDESEREWAALLRDLHLRDEPLPALVVRTRTGGAMFLVFGRHGGPLAVIRLDVDGTRGFRPAQIAETRRFLDEHGAAITHWIVDGAAPQWRRSSAPVMFVIDEQLRPVLAEEADRRRLAAARALPPAQRSRAAAARRNARAAHRRAGRRRRAAAPHRARCRSRSCGSRAGRRVRAVLSGLGRAGAPPCDGAARDDALRPEPARRPGARRSAARRVEHGDRRVAVDLGFHRDVPSQATAAQDELAQPHRAHRRASWAGRGA